MKKKILTRAAIGFLAGAAMMYLVPALINGSPDPSAICSLRLVQSVGAPAALLLTLLVMGLFGSVCFGCTLFYEIERWPLALATAAHYLAISLGYLIPCRLLCWDLPLWLLLRIEAAMTLGFVLIWLVLYLRYRSVVRELNELTQKRKKEE